MMASIPWPVFVLLFTAGLAGSLHCIGMCGPIVVGFAQSFDRVSLTVNGGEVENRSGSLALDFLGYHIGRIWTYAMLGLVAGMLGHAVRATGAWYGIQRSVSLALAGAIVVAGVVMLLALPLWKGDVSRAGCGWRRLSDAKWFRAIVGGRGWSARLILGAIMGFLPCGLVYANLVVAAALPRPWQAAAAMAAFGLGTVPSLTGVIVATRVMPRRFTGWLAPYAQRLAAVVLILTGAWMFYRTWVGGPETGCPMCESAATHAHDGRANGKRVGHGAHEAHEADEAALLRLAGESIL